MSKDNFCKSQLITCNRVNECNGVCPFEDALKHADKEMDEQTVINHDRDWIIGCIEHDGFIHTHRFDKANQIILEALQTEWISVGERLPDKDGWYLVTVQGYESVTDVSLYSVDGSAWGDVSTKQKVTAWMPLPEPYREDGEE